MRKVGGGETNRHALIDGNNLLHRVYHSYVESRIERGEKVLATKDGYPTGLILGFLSTLGSWLHSLDATRVSVFFDGSPKFRKSIDPSYKSGRGSSPVSNIGSDSAVMKRRLSNGYEAPNEVNLLAYILHLLNCDIYHDPMEEADDLISSFCKNHPESIRIIVSSDKDFFQLLQDPRVVCYIPNGDGDRFFDAEKSTKYWEKLSSVRVCVPPTHVRMFKALCGDSSDSIIGVDRLRKKIAINLCHLQTIDDVLSTGLPGFSAAERSKFIESQDRLRRNLELVSFRDSLDVSRSMLFRGIKAFDEARHILSNDLDIRWIDVNPYDLCRSTSPIMPTIHDDEGVPPVPPEDWLLGI